MPLILHQILRLHRIHNIQFTKKREYAKLLRLGVLRGGDADIIHKAQINQPTYLDFLTSILKDEVENRQKNELRRRMKMASLPRTCDLDKFDFNHSAGVTKPQFKPMGLRT